MVLTPAVTASAVPLQTLAVRGDAVALPVDLVDQRVHLVTGDLRRVRMLELDGPRTGRHELDEVGAGAQLRTRGPPHPDGTVGLAAHWGKVP